MTSYEAVKAMTGLLVVMAMTFSLEMGATTLSAVVKAMIDSKVMPGTTG